MQKIFTSKKWIAILLSLILVVGSLPINAIALESNTAIDSTTANDSSELIADSQEYTDDEVIGEIVEVTSLRKENVKHFRLADGTYEAVVYTHPVHRKDENGVWQDIDNNLSLAYDGGSQKYRTPDSRVKFTESFKANEELFTLSENGYSISMMLVSNNTSSNLSLTTENLQLGSESKPTVNNAPKRTVGKSFDSIDDAATINNRSSIVYNGVRVNTAIEYVLQGNDLKENIIVSAPCENYEYQFQMSLVGLRAELDSKGNIKLYDLQTDQSQYIIPAPYMYDNNGEYSTAVSYKLISVKDGVYLLNVSADESWINSSNRAFPVTIDPSISLDENVWDSYTYSTYPDENYGYDEELWVSNYRTSYIYMDIPDLPDGATFNRAYLYVSYYYYVTAGSLLAGAYQVLEDWDEGSITYNNAPAVSSTRLDTDILTASESITESSPGLACFIITDAVSDWYDDSGSNFGIAIKRESSTTYTNGSVILKSYEADDDDYAYISVNYTYYVPDGVYALQNDSSTTRWMTVEDDSVWAGNHIQQVYSASSPASTSVFDRSSLFKISRVSGTSRYIIRSMLNNNLSFGISGTEIVTKEIPSADSDVTAADTFCIEWDGYGFLIRPYGSSNVIKMASTSTANLTTVAKTSATSYARWNLVQYTGANRGGAILYFPTNITEGEPAKFSAKVWSTSINVNSPYLYVDDAYEDMATSTWYPETKKLITYPQENGTYVIKVDIQKNSTTFYTVSFTRTIAQNTDPLYKDNISFVRYTDITTSRSSHLLTVIGSSIGADDTFIVRNMNNNMSRSFSITDDLIDELTGLEAAYHDHLLPYFQSSTEEAAAHAAKGETDQLVDDGYITYGSSEYYGAWASNYNEELNILYTLTQYVKTYTAIYGVYMAATNIFYSHMYSNIYTVSSTQYQSTVSQIDDIANQLTNRPSSTKVMLGTTTDTVTWYGAGESQKMTYFYTPDWDDYVALYGDDMMRAANKHFLNTQKMAGKEFWFSHNPMQTLLNYPESSFAMELNWLKEAYGLTELTAANFVQSGSYWYFVP